jgi:hypothetical protein
MHYTKHYKCITPNYDLKKAFAFLQSHNYVKQPQGLFENSTHFVKSVQDDFKDIFELSIMIIDNSDHLVFECNSINNEGFSVGIKKYMKLLTETCISILLEDDYKEEQWKKFYEQIKNRKAAFNIGNFVLDVLDLF